RISLDGVLVTDFHLEPAHFPGSVELNDAGPVVRSIEWHFRELDAALGPNQVDLLEWCHLHGAGKCGGADAKVEDARGHPVHLESRIDLDKSQHALRFRVKQPAR